MASSPGRSTDSRTVASVVTNTNTAITFPSGTITTQDIGRLITGAGFVAGTTITAVGSATAATVSIATTASATVTATLAGLPSSLSGLGFTGYSVETAAESAVYSIAAGAGASAPSVLADSTTRVAQRNR